MESKTGDVLGRPEWKKGKNPKTIFT